MIARILIVEDNKPSRDVLRGFVTQAGYGAIEAADGNEAIDVIQKGGVDGIFLDLLMPERDGLEVLAWLKREGLSMPVIVFTGAGEGRDISYPEIAERFGAIKSFPKPITADKVREAIALIEKGGKNT